MDDPKLNPLRIPCAHLHGCPNHVDVVMANFTDEAEREAVVTAAGWTYDGRPWCPAHAMQAKPRPKRKGILAHLWKRLWN